MADRSELLFSLVGVVGRDLQRRSPGWDGFAMAARFDPGGAEARSWYYLAGGHAGEVVPATEAISTFEELRSVVEVPGEPVRIGVLTYVRESGAADLRMLTDRDDLTVFGEEHAEQLGARLRPQALG